MSPIYDKGFNLIINRDTILAKYQSLVNKNVSFLDYTKDSICRHPEYFNTNSHLGQAGSIIFSKTLSNDLLKLEREKYGKQ